MKEYNTEQINRDRDKERRRERRERGGEREKSNMCNRVCVKHEAGRYVMSEKLERDRMSI